MLRLFSCLALIFEAKAIFQKLNQTGVNGVDLFFQNRGAIQSAFFYREFRLRLPNKETAILGY